MQSTEQEVMMKKWFWRIVFLFLIIVAIFGTAAYVMQEAFHQPITFKEFFEMIGSR